MANVPVGRRPGRRRSNNPMKQLSLSNRTQRDIHCAICPARGKNIFCSASKDEARMLDRFKSPHDYKKGQVLFYEGTPAAGVYCVYSGQVKLYKSASGGRQQIIGIAEAGDVLGYQSLFTDKPLSVNAEVMEDSTVCFIGKDGFRAFLAQNPSISLNIVKELCLELESLEDKLLDRVDKPAHVRMARLLLMLKETHAKPGRRGPELDITLSRLEIAEMIGVTQETAIRILSRFKARGFIGLERHTIIFENPAGLLKVARVSP
jgi:CRP-like cAMP-binding protein